MDIADKIRLSNIEVHRLEADIYDAIHPEIFGSFEQRKIARDLDLIASIMARDSAVRVLDLGCGTGNLTLKYVERGYRVKAVDISPEMIQVLRSKLDPAVSEWVELVVGDVEEVVANSRTYGMWDIVSFCSVLHHLPDYKLVLTHALRQLRPGGVLHVCHEPLRKSDTESGLIPLLLAKILDAIDNLYICTRKFLVYLLQSLWTRKFLKRIDYSWSDYHARPGIDAKEVLGELESAGARTLLYETYRSRYSILLASLDARFGISEHSQFRFITQRRSLT